MIAPASVPHVMIVDSFHHRVPSPRPLDEQIGRDVGQATDTSEVSHTRRVSGCS
jgi:hypothetical protein